MRESDRELVSALVMVCVPLEGVMCWFARMLRPDRASALEHVAAWWAVAAVVAVALVAACRHLPRLVSVASVTRPAARPVSSMRVEPGVDPLPGTSNLPGGLDAGGSVRPCAYARPRLTVIRGGRDA